MKQRQGEYNVSSILKSQNYFCQRPADQMSSLWPENKASHPCKSICLFPQLHCSSVAQCFSLQMHSQRNKKHKISFFEYVCVLKMLNVYNNNVAKYSYNICNSTNFTKMPHSLRDKVLLLILHLYLSPAIKYEIFTKRTWTSHPFIDWNSCLLSVNSKALPLLTL